MIRDSAGSLYGTTRYGGPADAGTVYEVDATGHETVLHAFTAGTDGYQPIAGVIRDAAGNLYGTTQGGTSGFGAVYKLDATGRLTVLYSFTRGTDGGNPIAGVILDSAGNLYGTTSGGGTAGGGVVYKLDAAGHETVLYSFAGFPDGSLPNSSLIRDSAGNFYGTTLFGGAADFGAVYKLDTAGHETVLYSFTNGQDGSYPEGGVIRDQAGNLYGTAQNGGTANQGVVYKLDTTGHQTVLYSFTGGADGSQPYAGVIRDMAGNLYGTTLYGGAAEGVVFKLDTAGHETVLYNFMGATGGAWPYSGLILDSAGNLYGTTSSGGARNGGVVFKLKGAAAAERPVRKASSP